MMIDRKALFDALRQFIDTTNVHEMRIFPDRVEVCRYARGKDGLLLFDGAGNLHHVVETHSLEDPAVSVDNSHS